MNSVLSSVSSLMQMLDGKAQEFINEIDNVHIVWLEELQQEAHRMFSRDFNTEPELMPKTPSQKKNSRRKRVSLGRQDESQARRRFSKGRRSNLRGSAVKSLNLIDEEESTSEASTSEASSSSQSKRPTRKKKQTKSQEAEEVSQSTDVSKSEDEQNKKPEEEMEEEVKDSEATPADTSSPVQSPAVPLRDVSVSISPAERLSAEMAKQPEPSPGRSATKIAIAGNSQRSRRSSARCSLNLRHSLAGLRHRMTQESVRRASRRSMMKKKAARAGNSTCSSNVEDTSNESAEEESEEDCSPVEVVPTDTVDNAAPEALIKTPEIDNAQKTHMRITRLVAANSPSLAPPPLFDTKQKKGSDDEMTVDSDEQPVRRSSRSTKRKAVETGEESPAKRLTPPKKTQAIIKPNMRSFLHTVQKNQMLMMTPNSLSRTAVMKSFIKHTTPLKVDPKTKERQKLELLKKKQEQEEERMKKMEEQKRKKQEELKRKRDERLKRVIEAKVKEEQKEEEKKKRIEQKMAQIFDKNDKRLAEEKAKKKAALKRQEELELKKKLEEEAKKKAEEEKRQQEILAQKKAEEEELQARKLAEARKALELEQERERQAAAERARVEKEKLLALQREVERAAREKEMRELENKRKALEEKRKLEEQKRLEAQENALKEREAARLKEAAAKQISSVLNTTVDIERSALNSPAVKGPLLNVTVNVDEPTSPQSYVLSPKGGNKPVTSTADNYGMDQNSDDSTDDESAPRKQIPSWAQGPNLQRAIMKQYFNPPDLDSFCGVIEPIKLEEIFNKKKPRYFKRTSSAVWHSPLAGAK